MTNRRYSEAEVREIFELAMQDRATERTALPSSEGLTLTDIQDIGQEVGLAPADLARAAAVLDARGVQVPRCKSLGMPVGVGRIVPLPRAMTDHEWDQLVAELRTTFNARGRVNSQGGLREWTNGNLHAMVEPSETGYRLRLGTLKSDGMGWNALGMIGITVGAVSFGIGAITGGIADVMPMPVVMSWAGIAALAGNAVRLPRWARTREQQMAHIAAKAAAIMKTEPQT
jgi:hypothetical protein